MKLKSKIWCGILLTMMLVTTISVYANAASVTYTELGVPNINSSFKTYMDYRCVTNTSSPQYKFINTWGWVDDNGFLRCSGESDFGVTDNYYVVAMGSYYSTTPGDKFRITTDTGNVFYAAIGDLKDDRHTNSTHQYTIGTNDILEFLVYTPTLLRDVKFNGSANVYMPLNGSIAKVEKMTFVY